MGVEGTGPVGGPGIRTGGALEAVVVLVVLVLVVVGDVVGTWTGMDFGMSGGAGCCGVVLRGM